MKPTFKNTKEVNEACKFPRTVKGKQVYLNTYSEKGFDIRISEVKTVKGELKANTNTGWILCKIEDIILK